MTKRKRKAIIAVIAVLLAILIVVPILATILSASAVTQSEIDALEADRDAISAKMDEIQNEIYALREEQTSVLEMKAALDAQNELMRQEIEVITEQIDMYSSFIANKEQELEEAEQAFQEQYERYRTRMRAMEENGKLSYIAILFNATSFSDLLARIDFVSEIMTHDNELEENYIAAKENLETVKAEYEAVLAEEEATQAELVARREELEEQIEAATQMIAEIEENIMAHQAEYLENEAAEAALDSEINSLIAQLEAERRAAEEAAAAAAANSGVYTGSNIMVGTGSLIWPLPSSYHVSSQYGYRIHPIFGTQKFHAGIDIGGTYGAPILAADSGTVVTAVYSSSYGNYVMINHGNGLYTLYAHMSSMAVVAGQTVSQGQTIGYVGSTGWSTGPHLHYEVRVNGSTTNPLSYYS